MRHAQKCNIENFRNGDRKEFEEIYKLYNKQISYYVFKQTNNQEEAEEITSDTFFKLWKYREGFVSQDKILAFLYKTARNACVDYFRRLKRVAGQAVEYSYSVPIMDDSALDREIIEAEVLKQAYAEIEKLPGKCRKVVEMAFINNLKNKEIADYLKIDIQTVKNQKSTGIKFIRNKLRSMIKKYLD